MTAIPSPVPYFIDLDGDPLDAGYIYVGVAGMDARTNPVPVFWDNDLTIPAPQPIRTNNGYPLYQGRASAFYCADDVSITVLDKNGVAILTNAPSYSLAGSGGSNTIGFIQAGAGAVARTVQSKLRETISPMDFGAVGDGVADDGPALNTMFARVRTLLAADPFSAVTVTGGNGIYLTSESLNVTGMNAWNLHVSDLHVLGECTGKAVFDLIATRGYTFTNVSVYGGKANRPSTGFQMQRGTASGFCDNYSFFDCFTDGYFSTACVHDYGSESTIYSHCTFYNRDNTAVVAIHEGYDAHPMTSDYHAVMTGATSFINKRFDTCDYRYLPADENVATITGVTTGANAVITCPGHSFVNGDEVVFQYVGGMAAMSLHIATVTSTTPTSITTNLNTTTFGAYTSGGAVIRRAVSAPIYIARTEGFSTESCYFVSYGQPPIEIAFPDAAFQRVEQVHFKNALFEGSGQDVSVYFNTAGIVTVQGFSVTTYNANPRLALMASAGGSVSIYSMQISSVDAGTSFPLVSNTANFAAYGADVLFASLALVDPSTWADFNGHITAINNGQNVLIAGTGLSLDNQQTFIDGTNDAIVPVGSTTRYLNISFGGVAYAIEVKSRA